MRDSPFGRWDLSGEGDELAEDRQCSLDVFVRRVGGGSEAQPPAESVYPDVVRSKMSADPLRIRQFDDEETASALCFARGEELVAVESAEQYISLPERVRSECWDVEPQLGELLCDRSGAVVRGWIVLEGSSAMQHPFVLEAELSQLVGEAHPAHAISPLRVPFTAAEQESGVVVPGIERDDIEVIHLDQDGGPLFVGRFDQFLEVGYEFAGSFQHLADQNATDAWVHLTEESFDEIFHRSLVQNVYTDAPVAQSGHVSESTVLHQDR